ncbi:hypothetical protein DRQ50_00310 [bacterium]|nr:MAG: hypothetical protein DRQ50_00310 [bacterium]
MSRGLAAVLLTLVLVVTAQPALAQLPYLDPLPHFTAADSTSRKAAIFDIDRNEDSATGWSLNRLLVTVVLPAGGRAAWYLRLPVMTFGREDLTVAQRWPGVIGEDEAPGWPHETSGSGIGQLEVGVTGPVGFGILEKWRYGFGMGLPTAGNDLYPWSAGGMPVRLQLRPGFDLGGGRHLWLQGSYLMHLDASRETLTPEAFPNGIQVGAEYAWYRGRGRRWLLTWDWEDRDGRIGHMVGAAAWFPWTRSGSVGLRVRHELRGTEHRPAAWFFTVSFRFDGSTDASALGLDTD